MAKQPKTKTKNQNQEYEVANDDLDLVLEMQNKCKLNYGHNNVSSNNNEEDFENVYEQNATVTIASGRISGGSRESAFSSGEESNRTHSDSSSENELSTSTSSLSGRSSANDFKELNEQSISIKEIPRLTEISKVVDNIRVRFLDTLKKETGSIEDLYENSDLVQLQAPLPNVDQLEQSLAYRLIIRYLNLNTISKLNNDELNEATDKLKEFLKFRRHHQLSATRADSFAKEFYILSGIFSFGHDKQNTPVMYLRARVHRRWSHKLDEAFRRYVAWQVDQLTKSNSGAEIFRQTSPGALDKEGSFGICFDCLNVSYSSLDMEFLKFLVRLLVNYYPTYCRYALCIDLPWIFRSVWKLVRSWLPEDAQNNVHLITAKQLTDYIDEDQIPNCIKINDKKPNEKSPETKHKFPENYQSIRGIEDLAESLEMSSSELKQFKNHIEKIRKEYEQLGAI